MSAPGLKLAPLRCPACRSGLDGDPGGMFLYCGGCGAGYELSPEDALEPVPVTFALYARDNPTFYPFWVFDATLELGRREAQRSLKSLLTRASGLARLFEERRALAFYCPGFTGDLEAERSWGLHLTLEQPQLRPAPRQPRLAGLTLSQADARRIAEHLFLASEIEQPDVVRELDYTLRLERARVVVIGL